MEENIEVKAVEVKEETSPQEQEAAVLEQAIESGEVDSNYGFQDDGVYRVNVDTPPTQENNASEKQGADEVSVRDQPEASQEVHEENEQEGIEELTEQSEEKEEEAHQFDLDTKNTEFYKTYNPFTFGLRPFGQTLTQFMIPWHL